MIAATVVLSVPVQTVSVQRLAARAMLVETASVMQRAVPPVCAVLRATAARNDLACRLSLNSGRLIQADHRLS